LQSNTVVCKLATKCWLCVSVGCVCLLVVHVCWLCVSVGCVCPVSVVPGEEQRKKKEDVCLDYTG
jgi:hypothetical protein